MRVQARGPYHPEKTKRKEKKRQKRILIKRDQMGAWFSDAGKTKPSPEPALGRAKGFSDVHSGRRKRQGLLCVRPELKQSISVQSRRELVAKG